MENFRHFLHANQSIIITLIIVAVVVTILFLPFRIKAISGYDILGNCGYIMLYIWGLKIFSAELGLTLSGINIKTHKKKLSQKFKNFGANGFVDIFIIKILRVLKLHRLDFYANVGLKDAAKTVMLCSCLNIPMGIITSQIINYKPSARILSVVYPDFCANTLKFALHFKLHITLFDILLGAAVALLKTFKRRTKWSENKI
ncbi:MAG: hypothetical protein LBN07_03090 [Christensenellaceae bacterium]|nr:hypothetical protein [Christensenellaceae bacterium]